MVEIRDLSIGVSRERWVNGEEQDIACVETGINVAKIFQRPNEQASPDEDDNRKRYLEDYQGAASMKAPRRLRGCIRNQRCIFLKSRRQIQASGAECRGETEEYPGEK